MDYLELSRKNVINKTKELYNIILDKYNYDLVIFIARGSYIIGKELSELNNTPLLEIKATRKGNKLKKYISPFLKIIPPRIKQFLRNREFNSNIHEKNKDRSIFYNEKKWQNFKDCKKILLVDDSVDTGYSVKHCTEAIKKFFDNSEIKVAALNCFSKSENIVKTDFYLFKNTMLNGPWSNDSKENKAYLEEYGNWHEKN